VKFRAAVLLLALWAAPALAQDPKPQEPAPVQFGPPAPAPAQQVQPIVHSIIVEGEQRYSAAQLISALGQKVGEPYDPEVVNRGLRTIWTSFSVRAVPYKRDIPGENGGPSTSFDLRLVVVEMPSDREPRFIGNVEIETKTLKKWALLEDRVELFEYQADRVRQRLIEGYKKEGFAWIEIDVVKRITESNPAAGVTPMTDLIFEIREGPKVRVKDLEIIGNVSMPDSGFGFWKTGLSTFAKRQLGEPSLFNWWGSAFVQETLDADVLAIRQIYRDRGWLDAVVEVEPLDWSPDHSRVRIKIVIDEGQPYVVDQMNLAFIEIYREAGGEIKSRPVEPGAGKTRFTSEELLAKCTLKPGKRYEEVSRKRDELTLRDLYGAEGHLSDRSLPPDMRWQFLEPELFYLPKEHKLRVTYRIVEAHPLTLREISFAGTHHTRDEVLRRELGVFPGGKADQKEINKGLSRITGLGYFSDQLSPETHIEPTYRFIPVAGSKDLIDLEYQVEEGRVVEFNLSGGIDSNDGAFGIISLSMKNFDWTDTPSKWNRTFTELFRKEAFHGGGQRIDLELSPGTSVSRARFHYFDPDVFSRYLEPISLDFELRRQIRAEDSHDEDRFDKYLKFGRRFGFDTTVAVGIVQSDIKVSNLDQGGVPASLARQAAMGKVDQAGFSLDFRTQTLDNYLNPHNGWKVGLRNSLYTEVLNSDFDYLRSDLQGDFYMKTGAKADGTEHVLHVELDGGIEPTYGSTTEVPYTERFQMGGSNSLRGFARHGAGARGVDVLGAPTQFPAGGESYLSGSVEWLYPLYSVTQPGTYRQIESLRGVLFFDWGVLGDSASYIDLNDVRASLGFGVGLAYPLPIQLNFGYPIRRFAGDERQTFSFSIGISF
jgi:outer membrane protein insertion porin family